MNMKRKFLNNLITIIEKLIAKNPDNRPTAEELLKSDFSDPTISGLLNTSLAQYTYYLNYQDFKTPLTRYQKEMEILNYVTKECKRIFESHGAQFIETAVFQPVTNSFTMFMQNLGNNYIDDSHVHHKKKDKKKKNFVAQNELHKNPYIRIDYSKCTRMLNDEEFSFDKQCVFEDKLRIEYLNADEIKSEKYVTDNLTENWARYINIKNPRFIKRYCIDRVYEVLQSKSITTSHPEKSWEACFDICLSRDIDSLNDEDILFKKMSSQSDENFELVSQEDEMIHELEVIKVCYDIVSLFNKGIGNIKIIINSSIIVDIIMEECEIDIKIRHRILSILSKGEERQWNDIK